MFGRYSGIRFHYLLGVLIACFAVSSTSAQDAPTCDTGFRAFEHALGFSCIPEQPLRVVVLDTGELDNALALGASVVGAPVADSQQYQAYLSDQLEGIADIGGVSEPNLEAILALNPDLILGSKQRHEAVYEQLTAIAPTVFTASLRVPWQDNFRVHADALGKTAEADQLLADYAAHITELQTTLGDTLETTTISIIRFRPGQVRLYLKSSYIGYILQDVGLKRPTSQDQDTFSAEISIEQLKDVDADYVFVTGYDVDDSERDTFLNSSLWQTLGAVQNDHVVDINDDTWIAGLGVQAANLVLDDLGTLLTDSGAQETALTCETGFRPFDHEIMVNDPVCIPEEPQRVAFLIYASNLYPFGIKPIGAWGFERDSTNFPSIAGWINEGVTDIGMPPNLETLTSLTPDLMIFADTRVPEIEDDLPLIAPTIIYAESANWRDRHLFTGDVFGQKQKAEAQLALVDQRIAELSAAITARHGDVSGIRVSLVRIFEPGRYYLASERYVSVELLAQIGFNIPDAVKDLEDWGVDFTDEQIQMANADVMLLLGSSGGGSNQSTQGAALVDELRENPLWNTLDAFQNEKVFTIGDDFQQSNLLAAHQIIDGIARIFEVEIETPNPFLAVDALATPEATANP